jgi:hypothetical protein
MKALTTAMRPMPMKLRRLRDSPRVDPTVALRRDRIAVVIIVPS